MWLLGRLVRQQGHRRFPEDNGPAIRKVCARFVELCRKLGLLTKASVAIDGSNTKPSTTATRTSRFQQTGSPAQAVGKSVARYLSQLDAADRQERGEALAAKTTHLKEKIAKIGGEMKKLDASREGLQLLASPDQQISLHRSRQPLHGDERARFWMVGYNVRIAVDTEHHLIVAHEVTNEGPPRAAWPTWRPRPKRRSAWTNSTPLPTGAISTAWKSSPARRQASLSRCQSR